jgi:hypothetical protein
MADIAVGEAEIKLIQAELSVAEVEAEKAGLMADVAQILADIVVRGLTKIKLAVDTAELEAAFGFIEQKFNDLLLIATAKLTTEEIRLAYEKLLNAEIMYSQEAQKEHIDIERLKQAMTERLLAFERLQWSLADNSLRAIRNMEQGRKLSLAQDTHNTKMAIAKASSDAEVAIEGVKQSVGRFTHITSQTFRHFTHKITKG